MVAGGDCVVISSWLLVVVAAAGAAVVGAAAGATSAAGAGAADCSLMLWRCSAASPLVSGVRPSPEPVLRVRLNMGGFGGGENGERSALDWATVGLGSVAYFTLNVRVLGGGVWRRS